MRDRIRSITGHRREILSSGWELSSASLPWTSIDTLSTVAAALRAAGQWSLDTAARRFDAEDWSYRLRFDAPPQSGAAQTVLGFEGLATVADAWLNGQPVLHSENMFLAHEIPLEPLRAKDNELLLRFHSLDTLLAVRRTRPRWRTPMVENQQLRWFRTTLLGRTPGWSPPAAPVGPWRPIWLETRTGITVTALALRTQLKGTTGVVEIECTLAALTGVQIERVDLVIARNGARHSVKLELRRDSDTYVGRLELPRVALWWPHTHGEPALYDVRLQVACQGTLASQIEIDAGHVGFRTVAIDSSNGNFAVRINDTPIFCRGACWTPLDCVSLSSTDNEVDTAIAQARAAGMNMLRVGGTMVYETNRFLDACDAQGMLLWQDFMFANMDYPQDATFNASVVAECDQQLRRWSGRPCIVVLCGNSEGEQQAAMWGAPRERWAHPLFEQSLAQRAAALAPDIPYWPSSAHGGAFPHQGNSGTTSYYGVGAYRQPLTDARRAEIRFATECLGFANVPEEAGLAALPGGLSVKVHDPRWKARSPRDLGAGWDFDDIRDHYLAELFDVTPLDLRYTDHERYLELSRVVSGEVMAAAFREWRRNRSTCNGALIWFLRDLWPGAGWGVVDAHGAPKAPYFFLRRLLQPRALFLSDEGGNGLFAHIVNETAQPLRGSVAVALYRAGEIPVGSQSAPIDVPARDTLELPLAALFDGFTDLSYAYRFGPPACDVIIASLLSDAGERLARDFHFPLGYAFPIEPGIGLSATARLLPCGDAELSVQSTRLARYVTVQAEGFSSEEQYFHLPPGVPQQIQLRRTGTANSVTGEVRALNSAASCKIAAVK